MYTLVNLFITAASAARVFGMGTSNNSFFVLSLLFRIINILFFAAGEEADRSLEIRGSPV
jgi:hypothetical protein